MRTGPESRATLQLSDRSVIRVGQSTAIELEPPSAPARHRFGLQHGLLYFLDREKPADVEFQTPLAAGAIRGTEFLLAVAGADGRTRLGVVDGEVELKAGSEQVRINSGQEALVTPDRPVKVTAVLPVAGLMQWSFYYPAIVNPADLALTPGERMALAKSLADYTAGDLAGAAAGATNVPVAPSAAVQTYLAALKLGAGDVESAEALLPAEGAAGMAVRELIAAVRGETTGPARELSMRAMLKGVRQGTKSKVALGAGSEP